MIARTQPDGNCLLATEPNLQALIEVVRQHLLGTGIVVHAGYDRANELPSVPALLLPTQIVIPTQLPYPDLAFDSAVMIFSQDFPREIRGKILAEIERIARKRIMCVGTIIPWGVDWNFETNMAFKLVNGQLIGNPNNVEEVLILTVWDF